MSNEARIAALEARDAAKDECLRILLDLLQREHVGGRAGFDEIRRARAELQDGTRGAEALTAAPVRNKIIPSR